MDENERKKIKMGPSWWRLWIKMKKNFNGFIPVVGLGKKEKRRDMGGLGNLVKANRQKPSNTEWGW